MNDVDFLRKCISIINEAVAKIEEKITKDMSSGEVISDFVHSDDPKFKGKSKEERTRVALGAYYSMHPEKSKQTESGKLEEKWGQATVVSPEEKGKYKGKSKAELLKMYNHLKKSGPYKKGSPEYGKMRELSFAIRAKSNWGKVQD